MKKIFIITTIMTMCGSAFAGATTFYLNGNNWWTKMGPSVCKINSQTCYDNMVGGAYCSSIGDDECWDKIGNCWGKKLVCGSAFKTPRRNDALLTKSEIASGTLVSDDFDVNVVYNGCFGARKTYNGGTLASVNGNQVKVWCPNVSLPTGNIETLSTGNIVLDNQQPTCANLASDGFAAIANGKCWGKEYSLDKYYIDCSSDKLAPKRLIVLNGAQFITGGSAGMTETQVKEKFQSMFSVSKVQHEKYFE